jgi:hypothetical protein
VIGAQTDAEAAADRAAVDLAGQLFPLFSRYVPS